jgi:plasmid maintenance system antidote protein VapI
MLARKIVSELLEKQMTVSEIARVMEVSEEEVQNIIDESK